MVFDHPILLFSISVTNGEDNSGMLEGLLRGKKGLFPSQCVQEVRLRNPNQGLYGEKKSFFEAKIVPP